MNNMRTASGLARMLHIMNGEPGDSRAGWGSTYGTRFS